MVITSNAGQYAISVFGEPDNFRAALHKEGNVSLLITAYGRFLARLTEVELYCIRLAAVEEQASTANWLPRGAARHGLDFVSNR